MAGSRRKIATLDGEFYADVVVLADAEGNIIGSGYPLPPAAVAAGEAHVGAIGGHSPKVTATATLTVAATYVTGDYVGTSGVPWSWDILRTGGPGTGVLNDIVVIDKAVQSIAGELWLFDSTVTPPADSAAWSISDADALKCLGIIAVASADYKASALNSVASLRGLALNVKALTGTTLYGAWVTRGSPTYATGDLSIRLGVLAD